MAAIKHFIISIIVIVLLSLPSLSQTETLPGSEKKYAIPGTSIALPMNSKIKVRWVSPPIDPAEVEKSYWYSISFSVDANGTPWIGAQEKIVVNPISQYKFNVEPGYMDFTILENNSFLFASDTDLGYIALPDKFAANYNNVPTAAFQPIAQLPKPQCHVYHGANNSLYLVSNTIGKGSEVYLLDAGKSATRSFKKIFSSDKEIRSVTGDGITLYAAIDGIVVKVTEKGEPAKIYSDPDEYIKSMDYSPKSGLYISTLKSIIYLGSGKSKQIMSIPDSLICYRNGSLYILHKSSMGIFALDNIDDIKRFDKPIKEIPADKNADIEITDVRFFEAGEQVPDYNSRVYATEFSSTSTRYIYCQADLKNLQYQKKKHQQTITMKLFKENSEEILNRETIIFNAGIDTQTMWGWARFGSNEPSTLYPGKYTVKLYLNDTYIGDSKFTLKGNPTLLQASGWHEIADVRRLLNEGADVNVTAPDGSTPLMRAVLASDIEIVKLLLEKGANVNAVNNEKQTALLINANFWIDDNTIATLLINAGANVNAQDNEGKTPLHLTVESKRLSTVKLLLDKGADINIKDNEGLTPAVKYWIPIGDSPIVEIAELLIDKSKNPDMPDRDGRPMIFNAIEGHNYKAVEMLIRRGANINAEAKFYKEENSSVLGYALEQYGIFRNYRESRDAYRKIIWLLQKEGADLKISEYKNENYTGAEEVLDIRHMIRLYELNETSARLAQPTGALLRRACIRGLINAASRTISEAKDDLGYYQAQNLLGEAADKATKWGLISSCPEIYFNMGLVCSYTSDTANAKKHLQNYLDIAPTGQNAAKAREIMKNLK